MTTLAALLLSGCGGSPSSSNGPDSGSGSGDTERTTVRFALDWTPNTNHTGLYVAQQRGWFADAGLDVEILPYTSASPDTLVDSGAADFGISYQESSTMSQAAGAQVVSVLAVLQHWATAIAVRADRDDIASPRDLDGLTYAGFGEPSEVPQLRQVIRSDGGTGEFTAVVLGTSAYEALYSGRADFTIPFVAWEGLEAERSGAPLKWFQYRDFGFPDAYAVIIDGNRDWLGQYPEAADAFVGALQRGYQFAADDPDAAAQLLIDANPGVFSDEDLVRDSQRMLAADLMRDGDGVVGTQTAAQWQDYGQFLYDAGLLVGPDGEPLSAEPDFAGMFTDAHLPVTGN
ncbi:ABC transporter substrate-binding protein [Nakamurella leprariae]|uniref:ABC transporter substrate-binding protein n=1 Tax=Nakamurella leprariae TaxID=2803911 RepID=UPI002E27CE54|nr:ABC transporter substrate-binding protein [Nakamurella leprariae]